ncbi:hypothetical protein ACU686_21470 [Yinghuangia aomiensis]
MQQPERLNAARHPRRQQALPARVPGRQRHPLRPRQRTLRGLRVQRPGVRGRRAVRDARARLRGAVRRAAETPSISLRRDNLKNWRDRTTAHEQVLDIMRDTGNTDLVRSRRSTSSCTTT